MAEEHSTAWGIAHAAAKLKTGLMRLENPKANRQQPIEFKAALGLLLVLKNSTLRQRYFLLLPVAAEASEQEVVTDRDWTQLGAEVSDEVNASLAGSYLGKNVGGTDGELMTLMLARCGRNEVCVFLLAAELCWASLPKWMPTLGLFF